MGSDGLLRIQIKSSKWAKRRLKDGLSWIWNLLFETRASLERVMTQFEKSNLQFCYVQQASAQPCLFSFVLICSMEMREETSWNLFVLFFNVHPGIFKWSDFRLGKLGKASLHFTCNIQVSYFCCRWHREWWTTCRLRWDIPRHNLLTLLCKLSRNTGWFLATLVALHFTPVSKSVIKSVGRVSD